MELDRFDEESQTPRNGFFHKFERDSLQVLAITCTFVAGDFFLIAIIFRIVEENNVAEGLLMASTLSLAAAERLRARRATLV